VGDRDQPKLVFFFDEAHLLFSEAPPALLDKVEQVVRLIRSKGVGVFFVTQNPLDIPDKVLGQLGNRVQHALRAFTPRDQKAVNAVAETMRPNPGLDLKAAILELAVGEALISLLDAKGTPSVTERAWIYPPSSQIGPISPQERKRLIQSSVVAGVYEKTVDRESAFEKLKQRAEATPALANQGPAGPAAASSGGVLGGLGDILFGSTGPRGGRREGMVDALAKSAARSVGSTIAREITRGVLGSLLGGRRR
jgi:DNA helicase HerA-like ATPase